jgi:hypothetical protein
VAGARGRPTTIPPLAPFFHRCPGGTCALHRRARAGWQIPRRLRNRFNKRSAPLTRKRGSKWRPWSGAQPQHQGGAGCPLRTQGGFPLNMHTLQPGSHPGHQAMLKPGRRAPQSLRPKPGVSQLERRNPVRNYPIDRGEQKRRPAQKREED